MIARLESLVLDAADTEALARFYEQLLGFERVRQDGAWIDLDSGQGWTLSFQHAPDHRPPRWHDPDRPQQSHLDLRVDDIDAAEAQVLALGAAALPKDPSDADARFRIYADPAGHPFCLVWDADQAQG
ncbi:VOC family protein [Sanguibacter suaedae]|uniref:VOC family protein n=1 Tax=Sanguibacter suaedae TaxID=2795737 RepID=A0A934I5H4_9MICO|nr:VOC family protein [Sanguibacter suaedae]MBI9115969.1 VOC family protein [Sanguibacter suaedae]